MTSESVFDRVATDELRLLETALTDQDGLEADFAGDVLTIEFDDEEQFVINSHRAARQIWMSANRSAWHFNFDETTQTWVDARGGRELRGLVAELVSNKLGRVVEVRQIDASR